MCYIKQLPCGSFCRWIIKRAQGNGCVYLAPRCLALHLTDLLQRRITHICWRRVQFSNPPRQNPYWSQPATQFLTTFLQTHRIFTIIYYFFSGIRCLQVAPSYTSWQRTCYKFLSYFNLAVCCLTATVRSVCEEREKEAESVVLSNITVLSHNRRWQRGVSQKQPWRVPRGPVSPQRVRGSVQPAGLKYCVRGLVC